MNIVRYNEVDDSSYISNLDVAGRQINMKPFKTLCVVLLAAMLVLTTAACGSKGKTNDNLQTGGSASQKQDKKTIVCSADYPEYTSVDDLSAHADYVVYERCCPSDMNRCLFVFRKAAQNLQKQGRTTSRLL